MILDITKEFTNNISIIRCIIAKYSKWNKFKIRNILSLYLISPFLSLNNDICFHCFCSLLSKGCFQRMMQAYLLSMIAVIKLSFCLISLGINDLFSLKNGWNRKLRVCSYQYHLKYRSQFPMNSKSQKGTQNINRKSKMVNIYAKHSVA